MSKPARRRSRLEVEDRDGDIAVVNFVDEKISRDQQIRELGEDFFALANQSNRKKILLNFTNVQYLSEAMLNHLVNFYKRVITKQGQLVMCSVNERIFELFELTRADRLFNIQKDEQSALQVFT